MPLITLDCADGSILYVWKAVHREMRALTICVFGFIAKLEISVDEIVLTLFTQNMFQDRRMW